MQNSDIERIRKLPIWQGEITIAPLGGGRTNINYVVADASGKYVARLGEDIVEHHVMRFNELARNPAHSQHLAQLVQGRMERPATAFRPHLRAHYVLC